MNVGEYVKNGVAQPELLQARHEGYEQGKTEMIDFYAKRRKAFIAGFWAVGAMSLCGILFIMACVFDAGITRGRRLAAVPPAEPAEPKPIDYTRCYRVEMERVAGGYTFPCVKIGDRVLQCFHYADSGGAKALDFIEDYDLPRCELP